MSNWILIGEVLPKNGEIVFFGHGGEGEWVGKWVRKGTFWTNPGRFLADGGTWYVNDHFTASHWMPITLPQPPIQKPVKAKETASAGIPVMARRMAHEIYDHFCITLSCIGRQRFVQVVEESILKHAPKSYHPMTFDELSNHAKEQEATILMLTKQLCDKKEIIRRLTT